MQTEVLKGSRDFTTKDSVVLKDKGLVLTTWDEICDEIESVVTGRRTITCRIWWVRRLVAKVGAYFWWEEREAIREKVVLSLEEKDWIEALA